MALQNIRILASILFVLVSCVCFAQAPPPPAPPPPPPGLSIDGGVIVGLLAGLAYGVKRLMAKRHK